MINADAMLMVHGRDREEGITRARKALAETVILGCTTNAAYLERVLAHDDFVTGRVETGFIPRNEAELATPALTNEERDTVLAAAALSNRDFVERVAAVPEPAASIGAWQN